MQACGWYHLNHNNIKEEGFQQWKQNKCYMKWSVDEFSIGFMKDFVLQIGRPKEISWQVHVDKYKKATSDTWFWIKNSRHHVTAVRLWWLIGCFPLMVIGLLSVYLLWHKNVRRVPCSVSGARSFYFWVWSSWIVLLFPHLWWSMQEMKAL